MINRFLLAVAIFTAFITQVSAWPAGSLYDHERNFKYPRSDLEVEALHLDHSKEGALKTEARISDIKYYMLSGNLDLAKLLLLHANYRNDFSLPIQYRLMAIINFIEGRYKESLDYLNMPELQKFQYLKKTCLLKSLNLAILDKKTDLELFWPRCREATTGHTSNLHLWIETLISLRIQKDPSAIKAPFRNLAIENTYGDFLRIYMKLALYLNQQNIIFPRLPYLSIDVYKSDELRELIGLLFYRDGQLQSTYSFIEDLDTPNAENIKGNIYLAQKKYELAYAQFKLALQKKSNSVNALERTIPVAWKLRQWQDGLKFIHQYEVDSKQLNEKETLTAAFLLQLGQYQEAKEHLLQVVANSKNGQTAEVNKLLAYSYLNLKDKFNAAKYAESSCRQKDGIGCWLIYQLNTWEDFTLSATRDEDIVRSEKNLANLLKTEFTPTPLQEPLHISQKDIEELENAEINLLPSK